MPLGWNRSAPRDDLDERELHVGEPEDHAAGPTAVAVAMKRAVEQMGPVRTARTLLKLNQVDGFDCQGCAWPDPDAGHRHTAEFCENGAKAVTEEATLRRLDRRFFAEHPVAELADRTDFWLGQQGRLTEPMVLRPGGTHYEPIGWEEAFETIGSHLRDLASPDEAIFYTSGKTSNEAAFAYQLLARSFGTNNLPDCSNMCHESTSVGLAESIGIGKVVLLVVGRTYPSGPDHDDRLDRAAAQVGLERIRPLGAALPALNPARISMADVSKVFTVIPFGADMSLMPERIRALPSL